MKKILSLLIVAVMVLGTIAMVACGEEPVETTTVATTTEATTTEATTTEATTAATTTEAAPEYTIYTTGTTCEIYARFDYGTNSYAQAHNLTSHEYLVDALEYNQEYMSVEYDEDNMIVTALKTYDYATMEKVKWTGEKYPSSGISLYELAYDDIADTYEFDGPGEINIGWGSWNGLPMYGSNIATSWGGRVQYMKIRFINKSANTKISFRYKSTGMATYYTTGVAVFECVNQGTADTTTYQSKVFDACYATVTPTGAAELNFNTYGSGPSSNWAWKQGPAEMMNGIRFSLLGAYCPGNVRNGHTWATSGTNATDTDNDGIPDTNAYTGATGTTVDTFDYWVAGEVLTGAHFDTAAYNEIYAKYEAATDETEKADLETQLSDMTYHLVRARFDTRGLIKEGNSVVVDYIIFGSSPAQLNTYKSNIESQSIYDSSVSASISKSIADAATTAASK